jgi:type IV pilus assembly protein PilA
MSVDMKMIAASELYGKMRSKVDELPDAKAKLDTLRDKCSLDYDKIEAYVAGFDVLGQNFVFAVRMPKLGTKAAVQCAVDELAGEKEKGMVTIGDDGGRATLDFAGGAGKGWALDDDTLVVVSKGWSEAVTNRSKGEGKSAIDNNLKDAVALADRGRAIWFAGELPPILAPQLESLPIKGLQRVGGSFDMTSDLDMVIAGGFADDAAATAAKDALTKGFDAGKAMAVEQGIPQAMVDGVTFEADGKVVRIKAKVPLLELIDLSTAAFTKYLSRSKTAEARVQLAKMFDSASAYFNEEHVDRGAVGTIGAGGTIGGATHSCPNDGRPSGDAGMTPPLSVDCSKGCTPGVDYEMKLWTDNQVWNGLNFQMEDRHYFHYDFRWNNTADNGGTCKFTAQAFGDLDADKTYSTFERSGAADNMGINAAAGIYIDQEVE